MSQFDWPIAKEKETREAPQNRLFYGMKCLALWPSCIGEKGWTLGKTYGIKARCCWEQLWGTHWEPREHIENLMGGIHWELEGNKEKMKKKPPPPQPQNSKEKKSRHFEGMLSLPIGSMKFLCSKTVRHHFWAGLIPPL